MTTTITFSAWLRERRSELGATQEELSERLGFSPAMLRKLESGERRPSGQIASLLASFFRVPADEHQAFVAFARTGRVARVAPSTSEAPPAVTPVSAPWRGTYLRQTNLPAVLTPLVGREQEEQAAHDLLLNPKTRLLSLTGTAGIGKTRLALQVAAGLLEHFDDGIFFVDLAAVVDPDSVMPAIARALGLRDEQGLPIEAALLDHVRERRMLLVLDNFEQVLDAASLVVTLMQASPWIKVLVTSREALHVRGERRFPVPPLGVPDPADLPPLEVLAGYPSVELFLERARDVAPTFALTPENAADVAAVCAGLEGIPLAIELAASRAGHLSPEDMTRALSSRLKLLTGGARDLPARHRTLRRAIEWSYNLLDEHEQRLFRHLGVFVGGFTAEAVEAVYPDQPGGSLASAGTLASLTDKSLVRKEPAGTTPSGPRFGLLEAVREYALELMERVEEAEAIRRRHAEYYLSLADMAEQHFTGPQHTGWGAKQIAWIDRIEAELDNMRAALDWYQAQAEAETNAPAVSQTKAPTLDNLEKGLRLAGDLRRIWFGRGYGAEGLQRLRAFLAMVPEPVSAEPPGLRATYAVALLVVGRLVSSQDDIASARPMIEGALGIFTELNDKPLAANALLMLGALAMAQGDYNAARSYQRECLELYRALGNSWGAGAALDDLGTIELDEGNLALARSLLQESLAHYRAVGEHFGAASVLAGQGLIAYYQQDYAAAYALWTESLQLRKDVGDRNRISSSLVLLGLAAARLGNYDEARSLLNEGLVLARRLHTIPTIYRALQGFGLLESLQHNPDRAALLFGAAESLRQARQIRLSPARRSEVEADINAARTKLPEDIWNQAWSRGHSMTLEEIQAVLADQERPIDAHNTPGNKNQRAH